MAVPEARLVEVVDPRAQLPLAMADAATDASPAATDQPGPNLLFYGDNQGVLAHLLAHGWRQQGQARLHRSHLLTAAAIIRARCACAMTSRNCWAETVQYRDTWSGDSYLQFIYERLFLLRDLLADDGCIWLHCDYRQVHRLRLLLEEVFGEENYLNTIAWRSQVARGAKVDAFFFPYSTQYLEVFAKNRSAADPLVSPKAAPDL